MVGREEEGRERDGRDRRKSRGRDDEDSRSWLTTAGLFAPRLLVISLFSGHWPPWIGQRDPLAVAIAGLLGLSFTVHLSLQHFKFERAQQGWDPWTGLDAMRWKRTEARLLRS